MPVEKVPLAGIVASQPTGGLLGPRRRGFECVRTITGGSSLTAQTIAPEPEACPASGGLGLEPSKSVACASISVTTWAGIRISLPRRKAGNSCEFTMWRMLFSEHPQRLASLSTENGRSSMALSLRSGRASPSEGHAFRYASTSETSHKRSDCHFRGGGRAPPATMASIVLTPTPIERATSARLRARRTTERCVSDVI